MRVLTAVLFSAVAAVAAFGALAALWSPAAPATPVLVVLGATSAVVAFLVTKVLTDATRGQKIESSAWVVGLLHAVVAVAVVAGFDVPLASAVTALRETAIDLVALVTPPTATEVASSSGPRLATASDPALPTTSSARAQTSAGDTVAGRVGTVDGQGVFVRGGAVTNESGKALGIHAWGAVREDGSRPIVKSHFDAPSFRFLECRTPQDRMAEIGEMSAPHAFGADVNGVVELMSEGGWRYPLVDGPSFQVDADCQHAQDRRFTFTFFLGLNGQIRLIPQAKDGSSQYLGGFYTKMNNVIYRWLDPVPGADAATFTALMLDGKDTFWAKDAKTVYHLHDSTKADAATFRVVAFDDLDRLGKAHMLPASGYGTIFCDDQHLYLTEQPLLDSPFIDDPPPKNFEYQRPPFGSHLRPRIVMLEKACPTAMAALTTLEVGDVVVDQRRGSPRKCTRAGVGIDLTGPEVDVLVHLMREADKAVPREALTTGKLTSDIAEVDVLVSRLQQKLGEPSPIKAVALPRFSDGRIGYLMAALTKLSVGNVVVDQLTRKCTRAGVDVDLTTLEFDVLVALIRQAGQAVPARDLQYSKTDSRQREVKVDVLVSSLRQKLGEPSPIRTVRERTSMSGEESNGYLIAKERP